MYNEIINFIKELYNTQDFIPLHDPCFIGNEKEYLIDCIDSTYVSSVGKYVDRFEEMVSQYTGARYTVAVVNGTSALFLALKLAGVEAGDEVIIQPLTFVATANAVSHAGARPVFIDVDMATLGLSPGSLGEFLHDHAYIDDKGKCINKSNGKKITACVPMHTFGHPVVIDEIVRICSDYNIKVVEDAAESIGSTYKEVHTGRFGISGIISFNGNKTITTGGGGVIITDDEDYAKKAKHLSTTAKVPHSWEYIHDSIAYNFRMPNINAALGCAQIEKLDVIIKNKRELALRYKRYFEDSDITFISEPQNSVSNYWLNTVQLKDRHERDRFLEVTNSNGVITRPAWRLLHKLDMYLDCIRGDLSNASWLEDRLVNIPSGYRV